jgi:hypothetical protein
MKLLVVDLYRLMYRITGENTSAIIVTLIYVTVLNLVVLYGLGILLQGMPVANIIRVLFKFPVYIVTVIAIFLINIWVMSPFKDIKKERNNKINYWGMIMYTTIAVVFIVYARYGGELFK